MGFKEGDKVKLVSISGEKVCYRDFLGEEFTFAGLGHWGTEAFAKLKETTAIRPYLKNLKLVTVDSNFTKADLKERFIVKFRNGEEAMFRGVGFIAVQDGKFTSGLNHVDVCDFNKDLTNRYNKDYDIVEVYKPEYHTVFKQGEEKEAEEMTVAEIEKELGYKVKIIKEEI